MVSAPNRVEKIQIGYAKQAKKMDMKRLKAVEWSILQTSCIEQDKENDTDNVNEAEKKKNNETGVESSTSFSHLYTNLAGSRLLLLFIFHKGSIMYYVRTYRWGWFRKFSYFMKKSLLRARGYVVLKAPKHPYVIFLNAP